MLRRWRSGPGIVGSAHYCSWLRLRYSELLYRVNRTRMVSWSSVCFAALELDNALTFLGLVIVPDVDLSVWKRYCADRQVLRNSSCVGAKCAYSGKMAAPIARASAPMLPGSSGGRDTPSQS